MNFEFVTRQESYVAGLTFPLSRERVTRHDLDLIQFTWNRYRARGCTRQRVAAYVAQRDNSVAVLGYQAASLADVQPGDVVTRIPAGNYAKFVVDGDTYEPHRTVWAAIVRAERRTHEIKRTYQADVEYYDENGGIEVYVAIE
jgi:predicted transcriptional regulator YdeE